MLVMGMVSLVRVAAAALGVNSEGFLASGIFLVADHGGCGGSAQGVVGWFVLLCAAVVLVLDSRSGPTSFWRGDCSAEHSSG